MEQARKQITDAFTQRFGVQEDVHIFVHRSAAKVKPYVLPCASIWGTDEMQAALEEIVTAWHTAYLLSD